MGVMRIKEEAMFCNLPKEMFSKSLGMLKQKWVADVDCIGFAFILTTSSLYAYLYLCSFVHFSDVSSFQYLPRGIVVSKTYFCYVFQSPRVHLCNPVFLYLNEASILKHYLYFKDLSLLMYESLDFHSIILLLRCI